MWKVKNNCLPSISDKVMCSLSGFLKLASWTWNAKCQCLITKRLLVCDDINIIAFFSDFAMCFFWGLVQKLKNFHFSLQAEEKWYWEIEAVWCFLILEVHSEPFLWHFSKSFLGNMSFHDFSKLFERTRCVVQSTHLHY